MSDDIKRRVYAAADQLVQKQRNAWDALYAEWLSNRARVVTAPDDNWTSEIEEKHLAREQELARLVTTTPACLPWMILRKIEVLEYYLGLDGGTAHSDNREVIMLAGIKADLLRFEPTGEIESD